MRHSLILLTIIACSLPSLASDFCKLSRSSSGSADEAYECKTATHKKMCIRIKNHNKNIDSGFVHVLFKGIMTSTIFSKIQNEEICDLRDEGSCSYTVLRLHPESVYATASSMDSAFNEIHRYAIVFDKVKLNGKYNEFSREGFNTDTVINEIFTDCAAVN